MSNKESRFTVDKEGRVVDRRVEIEAAAYAKREIERLSGAKAKRVVQQLEKRGYEIVREHEQRFLKHEEYKQSKNGIKLGSLICV